MFINNLKRSSCEGSFAGKGRIIPCKTTKVLFLVGGEGLEPSRPIGQQILSLSWLPVTTPARVEAYAQVSFHRRAVNASISCYVASFNFAKTRRADFCKIGKRKNVRKLEVICIYKLRKLKSRSKLEARTGNAPVYWVLQTHA